MQHLLNSFVNLSVWRTSGAFWQNVVTVNKKQTNKPSKDNNRQLIMSITVVWVFLFCFVFKSRTETVQISQHEAHICFPHDDDKTHESVPFAPGKQINHGWRNNYYWFDVPWSWCETKQHHIWVHKNIRSLFPGTAWQWSACWRQDDERQLQVFHLMMSVKALSTDWQDCRQPVQNLNKSSMS